MKCRLSEVVSVDSINIGEIHITWYCRLA